ncbi:hypothetical protein O181_006112 [Austropuccinia psidii MF-1]|uniref:Uncharacterized protein n=1 Tax=Austropuccinia psidii MF-1 TaxID=1389203 RepID=A0A9Q3BK40_9BASI|nr:hypothetical protein [Austropuccinia psidii MF-1]
MTASEDVKEKIESIQGYEEKHFEKLKEEPITECGRVEPDRRYKPGFLEKLFNITKKEGGISTLSEYKRFISEYEKILNYLYKYGYLKKEVKHNEEFYEHLSSDIITSIIKEIRRDKLMVKSRDGQYVVPPLKALGKYMEQELETVIISKERSEYVSNGTEANKSFPSKDKEKKTRFEDKKWKLL